MNLRQPRLKPWEAVLSLAALSHLGELPQKNRRSELLQHLELYIYGLHLPNLNKLKRHFTVVMPEKGKKDKIEITVKGREKLGKLAKNNN